MSQNNEFDNEEILKEIKKLKLELGHEKEVETDSADTIPEKEVTETSKEKQVKMPEIKLSYDRPHISNLVHISESEDAAKYLRTVFDPDTINMQEHFVVLFLNRGNYVLGYQSLAVGGVSSVVVDVRLILSTALKCLCSGIVLCHNHPSGNLNPSKADRGITSDIQRAAKYHDITVLDHIILTSEGYYSFADHRLISNSSYV